MLQDRRRSSQQNCAAYHIPTQPMGYLLYDQDDSRWSTYFKVLEALYVLSGIQMALKELKPGCGLAYSKFTSECKDKIKEVPSRVGMLIIYTPAILIASWFFADNISLNIGKPDDASNRIGGLKVRMLSAAVFVHFVKRDLETLFLHRYSGKTGLRSSIFISLGYAMMAGNLNLAQQRSERFIPPAIDLTWVGVVAFLTGVLGNFYHHVLLRGLRKGSEKKYVIPEGGLFGVFVAPHYIFEIATFAGFTLISQTYFSVTVLFFCSAYLVSRSYSTKKWYLQKIHRFPQNRWLLIPYVF